MERLKLLFKVANRIALAGWLILVALPFWGPGARVVQGVVVLLLCLLYVYVAFFAPRMPSEPGSDRPGFFTLRGVIALFRNPTAVLAGWVHFLAFDLMVGLYIKAAGAQAGISHWVLLPCYVLTLMFGPAGLLLFMAIQWAVGYGPPGGP